MIDVGKVESLEEFHQNVCGYFSGNDVRYSLLMSCEFGRQAVKEILLDVEGEARLWAAPECPPELHINHGEFIKDGMDHILRELKEKPTSNRALYSLIAQEHISESGDQPIPSFMIFQCGVEGSVLRCAVYFRALEVSSFFRINLEEIRFNIETLLAKLQYVTDVHLSVFGFKVYRNVNINPLKKPKLDTLSGVDFTLMLQSSPRDFEELLLEKARQSTVVEVDSLLNLQEAVNKVGFGNGAPAARIMDLLARCVDQAQRLRELRQEHSNTREVDQQAVNLSESLVQLAEAFGQCR